MLAAVAAAAAVVGKADRLYRHAVAATAGQNLPEWTVVGTGAQANAGCRTALALMQLYFTDDLGPLPNLEYTDPVVCGDAQNPIGCFISPRYPPGRISESQTSIHVKSEQTPEVEHYVCLHEVRPPAAAPAAARPADTAAAPPLAGLWRQPVQPHGATGCQRLHRRRTESLGSRAPRRDGSAGHRQWRALEYCRRRCRGPPRIGQIGQPRAHDARTAVERRTHRD